MKNIVNQSNGHFQNLHVGAAGIRQRVHKVFLFITSRVTEAESLLSLPEGVQTLLSCHSNACVCVCVSVCVWGRLGDVTINTKPSGGLLREGTGHQTEKVMEEEEEEKAKEGEEMDGHCRRSRKER